MNPAQQMRPELARIYGSSSADRIVQEIGVVRPVRVAIVPHVANDGTEELQACLDVYLPIQNLGRQYHLPIKVWYPRAYPGQAPTVFVDPVPGMKIAVGHPNLAGSDGLVTTPYLSAWSARTSTLPNLLSDLSRLFGRQPPLFSVPPAPASVSGVPPVRAAGSGQPRGGGGGEAELRRSVNSMLLDRLQAVQQVAVAEHGEDLAARERLVADSRSLDRLFGQLDEAEQQLTASLVMFGHALCRLQQEAPPAPPDYTDVLRPADARSARLLDAVAADHAYADVIYQLEKAFARGLLPPDQWIRLVRDAARSQFYEKARIHKIVSMSQAAR